MEIKIITSFEQLWEQVINYAETCGWRGTKFLVNQMRQDRLTEWERVVVALERGNIAGFCAICKRDWISDVSYTPFITTMYVGRPYRGARLSQRLIEAAVEYLGTKGFDSVYLCSDHTGLYEKYGFSVIDQCETPWGAPEKIYRRKFVPLWFHPMDEADLPYLTALLSNLEIANRLHWKPSRQEIQNAYIDHWSKDPDEAHYIIKQRDTPIGWVKINGLMQNETLWVAMLAIHPEYQGKHHGRAVLAWVEELAKKKRYKHIGVQTTVDNTSAMALYIKCGFCISYIGKPVPHYKFEKKLFDRIL